MVKTISAKSIMIQGTASSAGKSMMVTALCRIFNRDGYKVAPFKSQNMALNSSVTIEGGEIGRAQAVQAEAAGIEPSIYMNPVLLKPQADAISQVIVLGKATHTMDASGYYEYSKSLLDVIADAFKKLRSEYEIIVIEGAGSPAEINLKDKEIVNMRIARMAESPVFLVADIDRGGVFASIVGTMELLSGEERDFIKGFIINKFRGDIELLKPGLEFIEKRYQKPVLGVIPYINGLNIAQEDTVYLDHREEKGEQGYLNIAVIRLPHISNYDDFDPLESTCNVRYIQHTEELNNPDLIILPGTKSTIHDLHHLRKNKLANKIIELAGAGIPVIGICGGFQILGRKIYDPYKIESELSEAEGLHLLDIDTVFEKEKKTRQVVSKFTLSSGLFKGMKNLTIKGYEIHMGECLWQSDLPVLSIIQSQNHDTSYNDGAISENGLVFGTYIHGLFHNADFTRIFLYNLSLIRGKSFIDSEFTDKEVAYNRLADIVRQHLDILQIYQIIEGGYHGGDINRRTGSSIYR